jgi:putative ATP-dependent endonuclease of OLD family
MVCQVRIENFRCLKRIEARLSPLTVLIGENNAGKTSFLDALYAAIGAGQRFLTEDDIFTEDSENAPPKDRIITIDVLFRPTDEKSHPTDSFPAGSPWLELWGNGVSQDDDGNDFVAIRTQMKWSAVKAEYVTERRFLKDWQDSIENMQLSKQVEKVGPVTTAQVAPTSLYFLDAKRDAAEDLRTRGSVWYRMISDPGLSDADIADIEGRLTEINDLIVSKSEVLAHVQYHLSRVGEVVNCPKDGISVTPVARRLRDLNKGMDVVLSTKGASPFPIARQGMGTRSLATVLLFRAYMTWKQEHRKTDALHPFLCIEEPETHLHPQAQRALFHQIASIPGQRIISTHSPYISSQADIRSFVHFFKTGNETRVSSFVLDLGDASIPALTGEDIRKINREVMNTRGDLLFARCIVLFEGETEEQALPDFARFYWKAHPHDLGVSFIGVGGSGKYLPFLRLATTFRIPWVLFSDGELATVKAVNAALKPLNEPLIPDNPKIVVLPNGMTFERYLAQPRYVDALRQMIIEYICGSRNMNENARAAIEKKWAKPTVDCILEELEAHKTTYGARIARAITGIADAAHRFPDAVVAMLNLAYTPETITSDGEVP